LTDATLIKLMQNELLVLQEADHVNIPKTFEIYEDDKQFVIISELISGGDMLGQMHKKKVIPEKWAAKVIKQTLMPLSYMHARNIMHRDVKLENLLVLPQKDDSGEL
jgi:serine/threonine protein kinase